LNSPKAESWLQEPDERGGIWSIPERERHWYFGLFIVQTLVGDGFVVWYNIFWKVDDDPFASVMAMITGMSVVGLTAAINAFNLVEVVAYAMVTVGWLRNKVEKQRQELQRQREERHRKWREEGLQEGREAGLQEGREAGLQEGREAANAAWDAWNRRRLDAVANAQPFDEPPPSQRTD
jgi:hypothetical protein